MLSVTLDSGSSPKKRTLSRGLSEDESLRSIIKETETSSRRLARSDSRAGTLKRSSGSQSEQDLCTGLPEMLELQASYEEVVQELRGLEVERETLLFQVDVLQDTLESVEELLAEAQREAGQAGLELEREREAKRKLESLVSSLMQEVDRLKEERMNNPSAPLITYESVDGLTRHQTRSDPRQHQPPSSDGASEEATQREEPEDEGSLAMKLKKLVLKPAGHTPSLEVGNPFSEDGVLRRPFENSAGVGRDLSPDRNDSDSHSAYEDASADTPELDCLDGVDLPHDSERSLSHGPVRAGEGQEPKHDESCVMS